jgi:hypothetical protein
LIAFIYLPKIVSGQINTHLKAPDSIEHGSMRAPDTQLPDMDTGEAVTSSRPAAVCAARTCTNEQDNAHEKVVLLFLLPMPYSWMDDRHCNHLIHVHASDIRHTRG